MSKRRVRIIGASGIAVFGALAGAIVGVVPANASTDVAAAASSCPSGAACTWADYDYLTDGSSSELLGFQSSVSNYADYDYVGTSISANDSATSVYNHGTVDSAQFFTTKSYANYAFTLTTNEGDADLNNSAGVVPTSKYNDQLSSGKFVS